MVVQKAAGDMHSVWLVLKRKIWNNITIHTELNEFKQFGTVNGIKF
jgi:hypothetical protein